MFLRHNENHERGTRNGVPQHLLDLLFAGLPSAAPYACKGSGSAHASAGDVHVAGMGRGRAAAEGLDLLPIVPGNVFTNTLTPKEAEAKGCTSKAAHQPTTIPAPKMRAIASPGGPPASRVDAQEQKARDTDAHKILQDELARRSPGSARHAQQEEYNNGQPERQGDEKNYQRYLDRTAELKASIARTEADVAAIQRELAKTQ